MMVNKNDAYNEFPPVMTVEDLMSFLHIGRNSAYTLARSGKLKTFYVGKQIRITREALIEYISANNS